MIQIRCGERIDQVSYTEKIKMTFQKQVTARAGFSGRVPGVYMASRHSRFAGGIVFPQHVAMCAFSCQIV